MVQYIKLHFWLSPCLIKTTHFRGLCKLFQRISDLHQFIPNWICKKVFSIGGELFKLCVPSPNGLSNLDCKFGIGFKTTFLSITKYTWIELSCLLNIFFVFVWCSRIYLVDDFTMSRRVITTDGRNPWSVQILTVIISLWSTKQIFFW